MHKDVSFIILMKQKKTHTQKLAHSEKYAKLIAMAVVTADFIGFTSVNNNFIAKNNEFV